MMKQIQVNESSDLQTRSDKRAKKAARKFSVLERKLKRQMEREAKRIEREQYEWAALDLE